MGYRIYLSVACLLAGLCLPAVCLAEDAQASLTTPMIDIGLQQQRLALAKADPQKFLEEALNNYHKRVRDYTCLFVKQERLRGKLTKEQHIRVKFREAPFAVFMKWVKNPGRADRVLYVKGRHDNKVLVKPSGFLKILVPTHVKRAVDGPDAAKASRRRLSDFGFCNTLKLIRRDTARAEKAGDLLKFEYDGQGEIDGRKTFVFERRLPDKRKYSDQRLTMHVDQEWMVPVATRSYDGRGRLLGRYEYRDVKLNASLPWKEFTPKANGL